MARHRDIWSARYTCAGLGMLRTFLAVTRRFPMYPIMVMSAAALLLGSLLVDSADARGGFAGAGFRGGAVGGYRGGFVGGGARWTGAGVGRPGWGAAGIGRPGWGVG